MCTSNIHYDDSTIAISLFVRRYISISSYHYDLITLRFWNVPCVRNRNLTLNAGCLSFLDSCSEIEGALMDASAKVADK